MPFFMTALYHWPYYSFIADKIYCLTVNQVRHLAVNLRFARIYLKSSNVDKYF